MFLPECKASRSTGVASISSTGGKLKPSQRVEIAVISSDPIARTAALARFILRRKLSDQLDCLRDPAEWPKLTTVLVIESERVI